MRGRPTLLAPGGQSPWLASAQFGGEWVATSVRPALVSSALGWLILDLAADWPSGWPGCCAGRQLDEEELGYVLLSAERMTQMLAHLHIGRLLGSRPSAGRNGGRWPSVSCAHGRTCAR